MTVDLVQALAFAAALTIIAIRIRQTRKDPK